MPNWIGEVPYAKKTVPTADWTEIADGSPNRRYLAWRNNSGVTFFVQASNTKPVGTGDTADLFVDGEKQYWDASAMTTAKIWAFQSSGSDKDIHIADVKG